MKAIISFAFRRNVWKSNTFIDRRILTSKFSHPQNTLLLELTEEWDQYDKKIKDVHSWITKSRTTFESPQYHNRPLRDQLVFLEKTLADITTQKTKITISFEKLQVTFASSLSHLFNLSMRAPSSPRFGGVSPGQTIHKQISFSSENLPRASVGALPD